MRKREAARDRGRRHHQHVGAQALGGQFQTLGHPEAVLFVDHGQPQVVEGHARLEHGMRPDQHADAARRKIGQHGFPRLALVAAREQRDADAGRLGQRRQRGQMLAGEDLGRRHQHALPARLDGGEQRECRDQRLARTHVALKQAVHALGTCHVGGDLGHGTGLRAGRRPGQRLQDTRLQASLGLRHAASRAAAVAAHQRQRHLLGEQFVIGQPFARRRQQRQVVHAPGIMRGTDRRRPVGPAALQNQRRLDPFRQGRGAVDRGGGGACDDALRQGARQRIDRLEARGRRVRGRQDVVGVDHLGEAVEQLDLAGNHARGADRKLGLDPGRAGVEEDQREVARIVCADHTPRAALACGLVVAQHTDRDGGDLGRAQVGQARDRAAGDPGRG